MPKRRNNNCSAKSVIKKFNELKYMTDISHTNKVVDKAIAKYGAKVSRVVVKNPIAKLAVK